VKYNVEVVSYAITLQSSHSTPHLTVLSEYIPHPQEDDIKVELISPPAKALTKFPDSPNSQNSQNSQISGSQNSPKTSAEDKEVYGEEEFVSAVLAHPALLSPTKDDISGRGQMFAFYAAGSHNLVYAKWVMPGEVCVLILISYTVLLSFDLNNAYFIVF
jgi:hypothetical protein